MSYRIAGVALVLLLGSCAVPPAPDVQSVVVDEHLTAAVPSGGVDYWQEVRPVLERRCVVCHGCYDAPCQLKLGSIEGILRGANAERVYDAGRLRAAEPSRLFEDAHSTSAWRARGFHSVADGAMASVMAQMLQLKSEHPLPTQAALPEDFDLSLSREEQCTEANGFEAYRKDHPLGGMPWGLPGLPDAEQRTLLDWLGQGAKYTSRAPLAAPSRQRVAEWEQFFNGDSLTEQLAARYLYEHLYFAHLYFSDAPGAPEFFRLVRSATPPGQPVDLIATRRPFDDPGVVRVYYRLQPILGSIVEKSHMPYALHDARMARWREWFLEAPEPVTQLPSWERDASANPFRTFAALPVNSRYRFLLDEAQFTIMAFIKGPVCRGQVALSVVNDAFWVFFANPDSDELNALGEFLAAESVSLELPASREIYRPVSQWLRMREHQREYLARKDAYLVTHRGNGPSIEVFWDGDGENSNAALTVFRHFDNASVVKGLVGAEPKTAWLIDYSILERIHYLLVAGYDVFGNYGHQLDTRLYMDFLRMEGESNWLLTLPGEARERERSFWYRDAHEHVLEFLQSPAFEAVAEPAIEYRSNNPKKELFGLLRTHLAAVLPADLDSTGEVLAELETASASVATLLPESTFIEVRGLTGDRYFTALRNTAHSNLSSVFGEHKRLLPDENTVTVLNGLVGAYPNALWSVDADELGSFIEGLLSMENESEYAAERDRHGVRRTDGRFWPFADRLHEALLTQDPVAFGWLDFSRLENR